MPPKKQVKEDSIPEVIKSAINKKKGKTEPKAEVKT